MKKGRKPLSEEDKGVRISIFMRKQQLEYLDELCRKEGVSRTKIIEERVFPKELQMITVVKKNID